MGSLITGTLVLLVLGFEGERLVVYMDTQGNPTIGVGFNLNRVDASQILQRVGADYEAVLCGTPLTPRQSRELLCICLMEAKALARDFCQNFDAQPQKVRDLLVDMSYNLGWGIWQFKKFQQALAAHQYDRAADELVDSKWYRQVGQRAKYHVQVLRELKE